ncbi:MAG: hypothetical protein K6U79_09710 [Firmicutes bacterium]|nr:hypothetical protein [Bacillota bacterium]
MSSRDKRWKAAFAAALAAGLLLGAGLAAVHQEGSGASRAAVALAPGAVKEPAGSPAARPREEAAAESRARPVTARPAAVRTPRAACEAATGGPAGAGPDASQLPPPLAGWLGTTAGDPRRAADTFATLARTPLFRPAVAAALRAPAVRRALEGALAALRRQEPRPDAAWARQALACAAKQEGWPAILAAVARQAGRDPALAGQVAWMLARPEAAPLAPWLKVLVQAAAALPPAAPR